MTMGCIWTATSYLNRAEIGNYARRVLLPHSVQVSSQASGQNRGNFLLGSGFLYRGGPRCYACYGRFRAFSGGIELDRNMVREPPSRRRYYCPSVPPDGHSFRWLL